MSDVIERFLQYVKIDTQSSEDTDTHPSTYKQHDLAGLLTQQLYEMGVTDVTYDKEHCYVYARIPATVSGQMSPEKTRQNHGDAAAGSENDAAAGSENDTAAGSKNGCRKLGFIAHMDTSFEVTGAGVKPSIVRQYDGKDIILNQEKQIIMRVEEFPELASYQGKDLIVTDGTTLLGADDKAGVSEIMSMAAYLMTHPEVKHGEIRIAFTPDEEIGCGTDFFDLEQFDADAAYTVDGGALGEIEFENFNAAGAVVKVQGRSVHPGEAKGKMINALLVGMEYYALLPQHEIPAETEGYEGFYHLSSMGGSAETFYMSFLIRDHSRELFENRKKIMQEAAHRINALYGKQLITVEIKDSYYNMREKIEPHMELIDRAMEAMESLGISAYSVPIRGGTDGARLSYMGLPCPNLCTGGRNYHSRYEYACVQDMEQMVEVLIRLACGNCSKKENTD